MLAQGNLTASYLNIRNGTAGSIGSGPATGASLPGIKMTGRTFTGPADGALNSSYTGGTLTVTAAFAGSASGGISTDQGTTAIVSKRGFIGNSGRGTQIQSDVAVTDSAVTRSTPSQGGGIDNDGVLYGQVTATAIRSLHGPRRTGWWRHGQRVDHDGHQFDLPAE